MTSLLLAAAVMTLGNWEFSRTNDVWTSVTVPHDWAIAGPFDADLDKQTVAIVQNGEQKATEKTGRTGSLPWIGRGEYRTSVTVPEGTQSAALVFEGAMAEPEIYWDGVKIGEWKYGYTTFCTKVPREAVTPGRHEVRVTLNNRPESSRWYPGAGLIRPVRFVLDADDPEAEVLARPGRRRGESGGDGVAALPRIEVRANDGFYIDGEKVKFQGACLHHDLGPLGAAWNKEAFRRQIRKLKDLGVNAIRTAHNPPHSEQLDVCDEEGVWVMAESFDMWESPKCKNGYALFFKDWWKRDLEQLVKVCRDHPCVVMYSIGNEVGEQSKASGLKWTREMQDYLHRLDPTRPVTQGLDQWPWPIKSGVVGEMDIVGLNYRLPYYDAALKASRNGLVLGSETASSFSSRGAYYLPVEVKARGTPYRADGQCSDYDVEYAPWANLPDDDRAMQEDNPASIGEFVWTGFDYLGEPSPYDEYALSRSSYFGMFDLAGLPKNRAYLYRSYWNTKEHTLHILPHWNWKAGDKVPVVVYTDYPSAELFLNGKSLGRRTKDPTKRLERYRLWWRDVPFEPGELTVVAYDSVGSRVPRDRATVRTAGAFDHYEQTSETWGNLVYVTVRAVDAVGTLLPDADDELDFQVTGDARFKAVCNGDPTSHQSFALPKMKLFHGQLVVILEKTEGERSRGTRDPTGDYKLVIRDPARRAQARRLAADGIVLLKNEDHVLPLKAKTEVVLLGFSSYFPHRMGWGSGDMLAQECVPYDAGLASAGMKLAPGFADFYRAERAKRLANEGYARINHDWKRWTARFPEPALTDEAFDRIATGLDRRTPCLVTIGRCAGESEDMKVEPGSYLLHPEETNLIAQACRRFDNVIVLLNTAGVIDTSFLDDYPIKGLVYTSLLGETSGDAVADILTGRVTPSGKTVDTWAKRYEDYPTSANFGTNEVVYSEGTNVGYRHFVRAGVAPRFPFGFGLSYTTFVHGEVETGLGRAVTPSPPDSLARTVVVTNVGNVAGAEVVQIYRNNELAAFAKTPVLQPGESCRLELATHGAPLAPKPPEPSAAVRALVKSLTDEELVSLLHGRIFDDGLAVEGGTGVGGGLKGHVPCAAGETWSSAARGLRALALADGCSGVRLANFGDPPEKYNPHAAEMISWPCETAIAQTWDVRAAEAFGRSIAAEMAAADVDGWLAPGLNLHRNPLCGRNFEYLSEDPLLAGKMGAAIVRGVQTRTDGTPSGRFAVVKHFVTNNQEFHRESENNVVSEEALRSLYLKPFEIVVKEAQPLAIMSSYNKLNGEYCSASKRLLTDILRGEWGFGGIVMTDWWTCSDKCLHPAAGNDLAMPGVAQERDAMLAKLKAGELDRRDLERSAARLVSLVQSLAR